MVRALVVGGGTIGTRKAIALVNTGASVHVAAPEISEALIATARLNAALRITRVAYSADLIEDAMLIVAATDDPTVNASVAADARARARLVNVVSDPALGNCTTPAVHRAGDLVVAVSAGGVPTAARRIRDFLCSAVDVRYANAVTILATLRRRLLDDGQRERWDAALEALVGPDFCGQIESGEFERTASQWR